MASDASKKPAAQNDQVKEDEMGGDVARLGEKRSAYRVLVGKPERKRL
jgi:hypothetical protein